MARNVSFEMGLPPFRGAVRIIILASVGIYIVILLLMAFAQNLGQSLLGYGVLAPSHVFQGWLWQLVSYGFMYIDPLDFVLSLLGVYFLGWAVEERVGARGFYGLFFGSMALSAIAGCALSLTGKVAQGAAFGSGAAANAILFVFYMFNRGAPIMLFPIPIQVPVKWIVLFSAAVETAYLLLNHFALQYFILLLGLGAGYVWYLMFFTRGRKSVGPSEGLGGLRNSYYRWKRRRAARKFEVYMRKHNRTVEFDEQGNYLPPADEPGGKKNGGSKSGWVN